MTYNVFYLNSEKKDEKDDDDDFLDSIINKNKEEEEKKNKEPTKVDDDLSQVYEIIGKDVSISKNRFQDNASIFRWLSDWKEGETRQT